MNANTKAILSDNTVTQANAGGANKVDFTVGCRFGRASVLFVCIFIAACTGAPLHPSSSPNPPLEFIDTVPMKVGVLQRISQYFVYKVETPVALRPLLVIYYLDTATEKKEPLATIAIDGTIVNEHSRSSIFAVSWDEKTLLYMHQQTGTGPAVLRNKPSGLYEYVLGRGDRVIHSRARIVRHSDLQLRRDSIEFALSSATAPGAEHYFRSTEGIEFSQADASILQFGGNELHRVAGVGDLVGARRLLASGINLEARDNRGFTPLHTAIWEGHEEMAKLLIESGADVNSHMLGSLDWTPVGEAARFGLGDTVARLLDHGARINQRTHSGVTPLHLAIDYKNYQVAETLVSRGADVNAVTEEGVTPLQLLANGSRDERSADWSGTRPAALLTLLLTKGADVNATNRDGATALHYAVLQNNLRTAGVLIDYGANPNAMELAGRQYYGRVLHHEGSEMTLQQRIRDTLGSSWWKRGLPRLSNINSGVAE